MDRPPLLRTTSTPAAVGLVLANLVPLAGVLWFDWSLFGVVWIYWAENGVIGTLAVLRILTAGGGDRQHKWLAAPAFVVHFGLFWAVQGAFVADLFGDRGDAGVLTRLVTDVPVEGLLGLVLSHGASFVLNYLGGERRAATALTETYRPYGRVVLLHTVILLSAALIDATGTTTLALVLFVGLKTALDLGVHLVAHRRRFAELGTAVAEPVEPRGHADGPPPILRR